MNTRSYKHHFTTGAARLRTGLQTCLFHDDPPFGVAHVSRPHQTRADFIFFAIFGVLVSMLGGFVLYLQSALARAGIY